MSSTKNGHSKKCTSAGKKLNVNNVLNKKARGRHVRSEAASASKETASHAKRKYTCTKSTRSTVQTRSSTSAGRHVIGTNGKKTFIQRHSTRRRPDIDCKTRPSTSISANDKTSSRSVWKQEKRQLLYVVQPNKVQSSVPSANVDAKPRHFEDKRKRFSPSNGGSKKGHQKAKPPPTGHDQPQPQPQPGPVKTRASSLVDNRNNNVKQRRSKRVAISSQLEKTDVCITGPSTNKKLPGTALKKRKIGSKGGDLIKTNTRSDLKKSAKMNSLATTTGTNKAKTGARAKGQTANMKSTGGKKIASGKNSRKKKQVDEPNDGLEDSSTLQRDRLPKRRASLEAHSAMVALTLQMQRPILKSPDFKSETRKRSDSLQSLGGKVITTVASSTNSSPIMSTKIGQKRVKNLNTASRQPARAITGQKKISGAQKQADTKPKSSCTSSQKSSIQDPPIIPTFSQPFQCTCQSPPACPVHYQLQCTCHQCHHHHAAPMATLVAPSAASAAGGTGAAVAGASSTLISSIFPFSSTPSTVDIMAASGVPTASAISIPHFTQQQTPQPGAWPASAWAFPGTAHVLATVATPSAAAAAVNDGIPAVFQGHLFIRPPANVHLHQPHQFNPLASAASLFVSATPAITDNCNLTSQICTFEHPSPPISHFECTVGSGVVASPVSDQSSCHLHKRSTCEQIGDMRAKNDTYDLIQKNNTEMTPVAIKSKNAKGHIAQKRKAPSPNFGDRSKAKRQKRSKKHKGIETMAMASTSAWEPVGRSSRKWVYLNNDAKPVRRDCYEAIRHKQEGEVIRIRDCIIVQSGDNYQQQGAPVKRPYVAKVAEFFIGPTGTLWASLAWYYWPEQAEVTSIDDKYMLDTAHPKELMASRHIDCVPVDSIEDVAYVVTINEFNRYVSENKSESLNIPYKADELVPRACSTYPRRRLMPADDTDDSVVFFCRRVYDFHGKRILRNPSF